jgi:hypothetical protein
MPVASFHEYARNVTDQLQETLRSGHAKSLALEVDQRSVMRGQISGFLTFEDQSELHFREFIDVSQPEPKLAFAYPFLAMIPIGVLPAITTPNENSN